MLFPTASAILLASLIQLCYAANEAYYCTVSDKTTMDACTIARGRRFQGPPIPIRNNILINGKVSSVVSKIYTEEVTNINSNCVACRMMQHI
jgi:hypothetical protein